VEAATPRHAYEWRVWEDVPLPAGKVLIPGVIAHTTAIEGVLPQFNRFQDRKWTHHAALQYLGKRFFSGPDDGTPYQFGQANGT
jgi:hypothetical protein